jgi:RHS repeat-associated protein
VPRYAQYMNGSAQTLTFDGAERLTSLTHNLPGTASDQTLGFSYNPAGQIASTIDRPATFDGLNRLLTNGPASFGYDGRGNLTSSVNGGVTSSYTYNADNMLISGPNGAALSYDPAGRLAQSGGNGQPVTRYQYDGLDLVAEYSATGTLLRRYVHGIGTDNPVLWYEGVSAAAANRRYLLADERGSITSIADNAGAILAINRYDEFGIPASTNLGRFGYTGQTWLPEIGMWHYKARIYAPTLGRFLQTDPIGYGDGMNLYAYVGGDPVNFVDPLGLEEVCWRETLPSRDDGKTITVDSHIVCRDVPDVGFGLSGEPFAGLNGGGGLSCGSPSICRDAGSNPDTGDPNEDAYQRDLAECRRLSDAGARARCYGSAEARDSARRHGRNVPPLITWREAAAGISIAVILYWIISEGSRIFPLRNLVPIP